MGKSHFICFKILLILGKKKYFPVVFFCFRTELLQCDNDVDFCVKVYCIRRAFKVNTVNNLLHLFYKFTFFRVHSIRKRSGKKLFHCKLRESQGILLLKLLFHFYIYTIFICESFCFRHQQLYNNNRITKSEK